MTHKASAILFDVLKSLFLFIYFLPVLFLCTKPWGGIFSSFNLNKTQAH